jgi:hypothetical protein
MSDEQSDLTTSRKALPSSGRNQLAPSDLGPALDHSTIMTCLSNTNTNIMSGEGQQAQMRGDDGHTSLVLANDCYRVREIMPFSSLSKTARYVGNHAFVISGRPVSALEVL